MRLKRVDATFLIVFLAVLACANSRELPNDANLEFFIETAARCAYLERAYAHDQNLLSQESGEFRFPANWDSLVDSLISAYGTEPDFWYQVYSEILERSRK